MNLNLIFFPLGLQTPQISYCIFEKQLPSVLSCLYMQLIVVS